MGERVRAREPSGATSDRQRACRRGGVEMRVLLVEPCGSLARCAGTDAIPRTVETALVAPVEPGDVVLVHEGVALARLDLEWIP